MLLPWLIACSGPAAEPDPEPAVEPPPAAEPAASPGPTQTIPEAEPSTASIPEAEPAPEPADTSGARTAFSKVPAEIGKLYDLSLADDGSTFTADPARAPRARASRSVGGFQAEDTARGGKRIRLHDGPIVEARWRRVRLADLIGDLGDRMKAELAGYAMATERDVLEVRTSTGGEPTTFAFSADASKRGLLGICSEVTAVDFASSSPQISVRKPVIYAYPERPMDLAIQVEPEGGITVAYPEPSKEGWKVRAHPDGTLEAHDRTHRYLFWESETPSLPLDRQRAFSIPRDQAAGFLEDVCDAYALTDAECGDFVTYWLPELKQHPYVLIDFPTEAYEAYAPLTVEPRPDTVIRLFMVFEGHDSPVSTEPAALPRHERRGFTVVEWGGAELPRGRR